MADTNRGIWTCKIGEVDRAKLPSGSDNYMRDALGDVYESLVGERPTFIFSGWGGELTEPERAVVEDREPAPPMADTLDDLMADEPEDGRLSTRALARNALRAELRPLLAYEKERALNNTLIHEEELRALRESHDALAESARRVKETLAWGLADSRVEEGTAAFLSWMVTDLSEALAKAEALHG